MGSIDPAKIGSWFQAHAGSLVLYAQQWLDRAAAEDVVQGAFVRLMAQGRLPDTVEAYLYRAVRNAAISRLRARKRRHRITMRCSLYCEKVMLLAGGQPQTAISPRQWRRLENPQRL